MDKKRDVVPGMIKGTCDRMQETRLIPGSQGLTPVLLPPLFAQGKSYESGCEGDRAGRIPMERFSSALGPMEVSSTPR